jgi:transposase
VQRRGRVVAMPVRSVKGATLLPHVIERVLPASTIYTDEMKSYEALGNSTRKYVHHRIKHAERVYVSGDVHTNTIEGFWSLVKRGLDGVYHSVSRKHLQGYLNEYTWRYNQRLEPRTRFQALLLRSTFL